MKSSVGYQTWQKLHGTCKGINYLPVCICDSKKQIETVECLIQKFGVTFERGIFEHCAMKLRNNLEKGQSCLYNALTTIMPPPEDLSYQAQEYQETPNLMRQLAPHDPDYIAEHPRSTPTWTIVTIAILSTLLIFLLSGLLVKWLLRCQFCQRRSVTNSDLGQQLQTIAAAINQQSNLTQQRTATTTATHVEAENVYNVVNNNTVTARDVFTTQRRRHRQSELPPVPPPVRRRSYHPSAPPAPSPPAVELNFDHPNLVENVYPSLPRSQSSRSSHRQRPLSIAAEPSPADVFRLLSRRQQTARPAPPIPPHQAPRHHAVDFEPEDAYARVNEH